MTHEPITLPASETILVVDDEQMVLDLCKNVLSIGGYTVLSARGGAEALTVLQDAPGDIQLALLDIMMPGLNGFELGQRIQRAKPRTKVVLMSGCHPSAIAKIAGETIGFAIIWKPFRAESLLRMIENVLKIPITKSAAAKRV